MEHALESNPAAPPPAGDSLSPPDPDFFRNPALLFVFVRICLYLILANAVSYALFLLARLILPPLRSLTLFPLLALSEIVALLGAFSAAGTMARLEKRPFGAYGLPWQRAFGKLFWQGAAFGLAEISAVIALMAAGGYYKFGVVILRGADLLRWGLLWALVFLAVGLYEEFAFRGYVQCTAAQGISFWPAAVVLSIVFGLAHAWNPGENRWGLAGIVLTGLFWCFTLRRTGNLWFAVGMHASFDFGETFLYSAPDSGTILPGHLSNAFIAGPPWITGGTAGPEASAFDFLMILLFFYLFNRLYPAILETAPA